MSEESEGLSRKIIHAVGAAIRHHEPFDEICDMFVDTSSYRKILQSWRDPASGLNLIQLAIVHNYPQMVEYLCSGKFIFLYREMPSEPKINLPLHLACKIGALDIIRYILHVALENEGDNAVFFMLKDPGIVTYPSPPSSYVNVRAETPFELCVDGGHADCALYLSQLILKYLAASFTGSACLQAEESTRLHDACYLGSPALLRLLLDNGHAHELSVRNQLGYQPLHVAASQHHAECLELLLERGAKVNAIAECKSALHLVYGYKANAEYLVPCTRVLVRHGIHVNTMDHNHNTALGYLAWEYGQRYTPNVFLKTHKYALLQAGHSAGPDITTTAEYKKEIFKCMQILLANGASTMVRTSDAKVDHTLIHTLLLNTGYPLSTCLTTHPLDVYHVLSLFFRHGADPNLVAKNNNESAFAMLIVYTLKEIVSVEMKCQFLHLFLLHGAELSSPIPEPRQHWENHPHRLWNLFPVLLALQEQHPMPVVRLLYDFMSVRGIHASFRQMEDCYLWFRITSSSSVAAGGVAGGGAAAAYKEQLKALKRQLLRARSLRHHCKLVILGSVGHLGQRCERLPLPTAIKKYLVAAEC